MLKYPNMCFKRSKERPTVTPPASILPPVDPYIANLAKEMIKRGAKPITAISKDNADERNAKSIAESIKGVIKR